MSKDRETIGIDGRPLPVLPPDRDVRVWAKLVRVMFYTPGFLALLLLKAGEPSGFGLSVELLMLASVSAIVGGVFIGTHAVGGGADTSSKVGIWSGALIIELLAVVPVLCAIPSLFHELANSKLLHIVTPDTVDVALGASELIPAIAILPFILYQLAGFGTLHYTVSKMANWVINLGALALIVVSTIANRQGDYSLERISISILVIAMVITAIYGVLKLRQMQASYDANCPPKGSK